MIMATPVTRSIVCPVLIGRESHLASLLHFIEQAQSGDGQTVLVSGEAGVGKSRLIAEVLKKVHSTRVQNATTTTLILEGRCFEPDRTLPYAPFLDLLRSFLAVHSSRDFAALLGPTAPDLVKLLPEIAAFLPAQGSASDAEQEKRRLFSALFHFFTRLAEKQPLAVIIEDIHWSDDNSLEFLLFLARQIVSQPILLLLTYRSEEEHPALLQFFAGLDRERLTTELTLSHLSMDEVEVMIRTIFGLNRVISADFITTIYRFTEGNPFFIEEMLKSLATSGEIIDNDGKWERKPHEGGTFQGGSLPNHPHLPRSVQLAVQQRLDHLSAEARDVLSLAAVVGRRFDFALLQHITERNEAELVRLVKQLIAAQLVAEEAEDRLAFRHALTRQAVYTDLLARERRVLHHSVGQAMEHIYTDALDAHLADLAYHFYMAREWAKVLEYAQRAGEKAQALYAPHAAIEQYTHVLEAVEALGRSPLPGLYRVRGQCYELLGDFSAARNDYMRALEVAQAIHDTGMEWQSLFDLGYLWTGLDYAQAGDYLHRALALARTMNDPLVLARTLNRLGNWHMNLEEPLGGQQYHLEALSIFSTGSDQHGLAETLDFLGVASLMSGDLVASARYYQQAVALWRTLGDRQGLISSLIFFAGRGGLYFTSTTVCVTTNGAECARDVEEAITLAHQVGARAGEAFALIFSGLCLGYRGEYKQALRSGETGLNIALEIEHGPWMATGYLLLGILTLDLLALPTARQQLERALALAKESGSLFLLCNATAFLASTCIAQGDYARAQEILDSVFNPDASSKTMQTLAQRLVWCARAELELAQRHPDKALAILDGLISTAANVKDGAVIPRLWHLCGEALATLGRMEEAEVVLCNARDAAQRQNARPLLWRIYVTLGKLYHSRASRKQAEEVFSLARTVIEELTGTVPDEELRDNFLRRASAQLPHLLQSTPRQAAKQAFGGLTEREREVAVLIAQGKSSRVIADELIVSERTIEKHVERIMFRLGFSSRAQIAAWVVEKGLLNPSH
jgi:DNA-binding CsgD family transcriptional regulator